MTVIEGATIIIAIAAFLSAVYAIWRNGRRQSNEFTKVKTEFKQNLKTINEKLDHPEYGLSALSQKVTAIKVNCATVSTGLSERLNAAEGTLKSKRRQK